MGTHQSFLPKKHIMSSFPFLKLQTPALNQQTKWSSVTRVMANTWLVASCIVEMLFPKTSMQPLLKSKPNVAFNLWIGALLDSKLASTINHPLSFLVEIWPRCPVPYACCLTLLQLPKLGPVLTISLTLCMPSVLSFIGMLEKAWKRANSLKLEKTWPLWRRIMKRLEWTPLMAKETKAKNIKEITLD